MKIWDTDVGNIVIWKLIETKNSSKYLIWYLGEVIRLLVLSLTKKSRYVKNLKEKKKLMSLRIDDEKYITFWTKIEDLKNVELKALSLYENRYIKLE